MVTLMIKEKEYQVDREVAELLLFLCNERNQLQYELKLAGVKGDRISEMYSGEMFRGRKYLNTA